MAEPWQGKRLLSLSADPHASVWVTEAADGRMWFGVTTPDGQASGSPSPLMASRKCGSTSTARS